MTPHIVVVGRHRVPVARLASWCLDRGLGRATLVLHFDDGSHTAIGGQDAEDLDQALVGAFACTDRLAVAGRHRVVVEHAVYWQVVPDHGGRREVIDIWLDNGQHVVDGGVVAADLDRALLAVFHPTGESREVSTGVQPAAVDPLPCGGVTR